MGRLYSVVFDAVAVTAAQDLFEVVAASGKPVTLHSLRIGQSSDAGDAQDEQLRIRIRSGQTTSGSGGTTPTPVPLNPGDAAFGGTTEVNNTTQASAGTIVTHLSDAWNVRAGYVWCPTPEERIGLAAGGRLTVELPAAPADSITLSGTLVFEEHG